MTTKGWASVGTWALDADRADAEERERAAAEGGGAFPPLRDSPAANPQSFPSLKEASSTKTKKKKNAPQSLSEFTTGTYVGPGGAARRGGGGEPEPKGLTHDELLHLPTGPRERSEEELQYGRGFRSYGYGGGPRDGGSSSSSRRTFGGGFDDEPRRGSGTEFDMPSRADEVDNWAAAKKPMASFAQHDRYSSSSSSMGRADDVDNWAAGKKTSLSRPSGFGSGFHGSSASDSDRWGGRGGSEPYNGEHRERPRLVLDPPKGEKAFSTETTQRLVLDPAKGEKASSAEPAPAPARSRPSPFGAARPREEVLAEKGLDWKKLDTEIDIKKPASQPMPAHSSRPSSAHSSRPESPASQAGAAEIVPRARPKVNPFGEAKPREVLLQEQGKDWRKMDLELEHRGVHRLETEEEKVLKENIGRMKRSLAKLAEGTMNDDGSVEEHASVQEKIILMERDLEMLVHELDDKVRFGQKALGDIRPGSGAGRMVMPVDRPSSQSGRSEDSRNSDFMDRPRSRGSMHDAWTKSTDDGHGFQSGRERGFFSNRSMESSKSRDRW